MTPPVNFLLRSEEHTSELQSRSELVCRLLLEKKKQLFAVRSRRAAPRLRSMAIRQRRSNLFFFNDTATTEIYTLSLHDALPIRLLERLCFAPRPFAVSLQPGPLGRRQFEWPWRGSSGGAGRLRHWLGDVGLDHHALGVFRRFRPAAHLRPRQPPRGDGSFLDHGQARPHVPQRPGLRPGAQCHRGKRPSRSYCTRREFHVVAAGGCKDKQGKVAGRETPWR